ncbi:MAG TPA: serine/threonine-protein kinase [Burkholderiales bacterium]|jgi:serine/threonine-protein kinase PpkA|nr:serine/threonine-protein kinase [Burkholderiales bacterium]
MRILIVDENADFSAVLREYLREGLSLAALKSASGGPPKSLAVKEWRPSAKGVPIEGKDGFKWNFDVLLINSQTDSAATLEWISRARASAGPRWPAVLLLVGGADEKALAAEAVKLGVTECVPRLKLTPRSLYEALTGIVGRRDAAAQAQSPPAPAAAAAPAARSAEEALTATQPAATLEARRRQRGFPEIRGYQIDNMIGEGGTSRVYLARRVGDDLQVVLKVLLPQLASDAGVVSRFMQEFSLIQKIKSAHVTRIFDLNYDSGNAYLAMEYFGAGDLRERIVAGGLPAVQALRIFAQVARALGAIHDAGVVHRDLKPHNIMFRDKTHLAIVDFGGAKSLGETAGLTAVGHIIGTPRYMSPEQITGAKIDLRSDLYSLGVILHLLLTGDTLYTASTPTEMMDMHLYAPIPRLPEELNGFQKLLNKLVAKDPEARFQSARELYAYIAY